MKTVKRKLIIVACVLSLLFSCSSMPTEHRHFVTENQEQSVGYLLRGSRMAEKVEVNDNRMVSYSASVDLSVENIDNTKKILIEQIKNNNGFIVMETESYITTRIPTEKMNSFINNVKTLGKTENESKTGKDITDQYRDDVIRLENFKSVRNRYLALLEKANTVNEILSIERELERVNTQIEILEGKIKYAEASVAYSNITVRFKEKVSPGPVGWIFYGLYYGIKWLFVWD